MDTFHDVTSFIEFEFNPNQTFMVGEQIHGRIHLYSNIDLVDVGTIAMNLFGEEQVVFNMSRVD